MKRWQKILGIALAIVVAVLVVLSFVLAGILTSKAREGAQNVSQEGGSRVPAPDRGPAAAAALPLVDLRRVEVKVALLRALFAGGKSVRVRSAEADGLTVNVIRFPDGTTNLEKFQQKLSQKAEQKP